MNITQEELHEILDYDKETGIFRWRERKQRRRKNGIAGSAVSPNKNNYYIEIGFDGDIHYAHRLAWLYIHDHPIPDIIDHIDGNGLNNRIDNLRACTHTQNFRNREAISTNSSGVLGVYRKGKKWQASIGMNGKKINLGTFYNIEDAIQARLQAEKDLWIGDFKPRREQNVDYDLETTKYYYEEKDNKIYNIIKEEEKLMMEKRSVGRPKTGRKRFTCSFALSREVIDRLHIYSQKTGRNKSESVEFLLGQAFAIMDGEAFEAKFPDYPVMPKRDAEFDYDPRDILP
jgi:hypothetical protein